MPTVKKTSSGTTPVIARKSRATKKVETVIDDVVEETIVEETIVEEDEETQPIVVKKANVVTKESVLEDFNSLIQTIVAEADSIRAGDKPKGVRFINSISSSLKKLQKQTARISKGKTKRVSNGNSGFLKPVGVSSEMRKFAGWDKEDLHSRVDVTRFICNYIKENDLQNTSDRRQIVPDSKLKKLFALKGKEVDPMPYYAIQTHIKHHFESAPSPP